MEFPLSYASEMPPEIDPEILPKVLTDIRLRIFPEMSPQNPPEIPSEFVLCVASQILVGNISAICQDIDGEILSEVHPLILRESIDYSINYSNCIRYFFQEFFASGMHPRIPTARKMST